MGGRVAQAQIVPLPLREERPVAAAVHHSFSLVAVLPLLNPAVVVVAAHMSLRAIQQDQALSLDRSYLCQ
jgi:hypothetical protein